MAGPASANGSVTNPLRSRLRDGEVVVGGWCTLPTSFAAEIVSDCGVDYAVVDMQHGLTGYSDLVSMLQAIGSAGVVPLVRIPYEDFGLAQRALDAGAYGLIVPMVNNCDQAKAAVNSARYPPIGERSYGPIRQKMHLGGDPAWVNSQVLLLVQIETRTAMANLDDILSVEGIDGVYVGPADLALTHGLEVGGQSAELDALLSRIVEACNEHGAVPGIHTASGADGRRAHSLGYRLTTVGSDAVWLRAGYSQQIAAARSVDEQISGALY